MRDPFLTGKVILVVDDEPLLREILCERLNRLGAKTFTASNGTDAFSLFKKEPASCVISDVRMPDGDGMTLLRALRGDGSKVPFFFITGFSDFTPEEAIAAGASGIFAKPFRMPELEAALKQALLS